MKYYLDHDGDIWIGRDDGMVVVIDETAVQIAREAPIKDHMALAEVSERYGPMRALIEVEMAEKPATRYVLDNDDDGHWYLIAEADKEAFGRYVYEDGPEPASCSRLSGHPNNVSFTLPLEFGKEIEFGQEAP